MFILTTSIQHCTRGPSQYNKIRKKILIGKSSLFADNVIIYRENPMEYIEKLLELLSGFSKDIGHQISMQKSIVFLCASNKQSKIEIKNSIKNMKFIGINMANNVKYFYLKTIKHC